MKRCVILSVVLMAALFSSSVFGATQSQERETVFHAIAKAYESGQINYETALLYKVYAFKAPHKLPSNLRDLPRPDVMLPCNLPLQSEIQINWEKLSPSIKGMINEVMARPPLPLSYGTTHFLIHYTDSGPDAATLAFVQEMATRAEFAYDYLINTMGYDIPPSDINDPDNGGDGRYDIYLQEIESLGYWGATYFGEEVASTPEDDRTSYIEMDNDYSSASNPSQQADETFIHEYFHAVQMGYEYKADSQYGHYWMEHCSTWIPDEAYGYDGYRDYLPFSFDYPWYALESFGQYYGGYCISRCLIEYGNCSWTFHLDECFGRDIIRDIWDDTQKKASGEDPTATESWDRVLQSSSYSSSLDEEFEDYARKRYNCGSNWYSAPDCETFLEGQYWPDITIDMTWNASSLPINRETPTHNPEQLTASYIQFNTSGGQAGDLKLTWKATKNVSWVVYVIKKDLSGNYTTEKMTLTVKGNSYKGELTITDWTSYEKIMLTTVNLDWVNAGPYKSTSYEYGAEVIPGGGEVMYVFNIDPSTESRGSNWNGKMVVTVKDWNTGNLVADALVIGDWSGNTTDHDEVLTESDGKATIKSDKVRNPAPGSEFCFCVTNITKSGATYDPSKNIETCDCAPVPAAKLIGSNQPEKFRLSQNYPNPFNPETDISYAIPNDCLVRLEVYNLLGQRVTTLVDAHQSAGVHNVRWNGSDVSTGIYFFRITAGEFTAMKRMILMK